MLSEKDNLKILHPVWFHLYNSLEITKLQKCWTDCYKKWGSAACHSKAKKRPDWWKEVCFILDASNLRVRVLSVQRLTPTTNNQWVRAIVDRRRRLHAKTTQSALTVIFKLVISGLISVMLVVLGTVNLLLQDQFVSISLRPVLKELWQLMSCGLLRWLSAKESTCQCRRQGLDPFVREIPREWNGNPLQYSCLGNTMDRGAWWATVHGVAKNQTWLRDFTFTFHFQTWLIQLWLNLDGNPHSSKDRIKSKLCQLNNSAQICLFQFEPNVLSRHFLIPGWGDKCH